MGKKEEEAKAKRAARRNQRKDDEKKKEEEEKENPWGNTLIHMQRLMQKIGRGERMITLNSCGTHACVGNLGLLAIRSSQAWLMLLSIVES